MATISINVSEKEYFRLQRKFGQVRNGKIRLIGLSAFWEREISPMIVIDKIEEFGIKLQEASSRKEICERMIDQLKESIRSEKQKREQQKLHLPEVEQIEAEISTINTI